MRASPANDGWDPGSYFIAAVFARTKYISNLFKLKPKRIGRLEWTTDWYDHRGEQREPESPVIARLLQNTACHKMPNRVRVNKIRRALLVIPASHSPACGGRPVAASAPPWHTCRPVSCRRTSMRAAPGHRDIGLRPRQPVLYHCWSPLSPRSCRTAAETGAACCRAAYPAAHRRQRVRPAANICHPDSPRCAALPQCPPPRRPIRPWRRLWALQRKSMKHMNRFRHNWMCIIYRLIAWWRLQFYNQIEYSASHIK